MIRRSQWVTLGAGVLTLLILLGLLLLLRVTPDNEQDAPPAPTVYATENAALNIAVSNNISAYDIRLQVSDEGVESYRVAQFDNAIPLYSGRLSAIGAGAYTLAATEFLETPRDLSEYGLDRPSGQAEITFEDSSVTTVLIGDLSPDGANVYLMARGDHLTREKDTIYLVPLDSIDHCLLGPNDLISPLVTGTGSIGALFNTVTLSGSVREQEIVARRIPAAQEGEPSTYTVSTALLTRRMNPYTGLSLLQGLFSIMADSAVAVHPDDALLDSYGLLAPYSTAQVLGEDSFTLITSAPDETGQVYLMREELPVVYLVEATTLPWLEADFFDLVDPLFLSPEIASVEQIVIETPDTAYTIDLAHAQDGISVTLDGLELAYELFYPFYQTLTSAQAIAYTTERPAEGDAPLLTLTFRYADADADTLAFYAGLVRRTFVALNGEDASFYVSSAYVDRVQEDIQSLLRGEAVSAY